MPRRPLLTVGLPFHNEEQRLSAAIRSILAQSFSDFELLLVDDGSTDRSLAVARSFDDARIVVVSDGRRRHLPARLNEITRRALGKFIARMDGDDVCHPTRLARQLEVLEAQPSVDVVGTWAALVDLEGRAFGVVESATFPSSPKVALERGLLVHASIVARRAWLEANPYDEGLSRAEDRDLWCRTVETTGFDVVPEPLYVVTASARDPNFIVDYVKAQEQNRALYMLHGPPAVGPLRTAVLWAASWGKSATMRTADALGLAERIVRRRGRPMTEHEKRYVAEAIASGEGAHSAKRSLNS